MRRNHSLSVAIVLVSLLAVCLSPPAWAVPITGGAGPGGFELANGASTLALWLDGSDINADGLPDAIANGATITVWSDRSGYARHANGVMGTPNYVTASAAANNMPVVNFVGASNEQLYTTYNFDNLGADYTVIGVSRYTGGDNERIITSKTRNWLFGHHGSGDQRWYAEGWIYNAGSASTEMHIYTGMIGPTVNGNAGDPGADFWRNGIQLTDNNTGSNNTVYKPGQLALGGWQSISETSNAEVAEVVIYNRIINDAERRIVENHLSAKYNRSITNDLYVGDAPGSGDYDLGVFGIGRVNATNTLLNAGAAGFGIEVAGLTDDGDYALAGHKVVTNSKLPISGIPGVSQRWARAWYVDVTDANDNVGATFAFDYSDAGLTRTTESLFTLLRSLDGGTTWSAIASTNTLIGPDKVSFAVSAADLQDALYTLGDASTMPIVTATRAPAYAPLGGTLTFTDALLGVQDLDSPNLASASVAITANFDPNDELLFTNQLGITGVYNPGTGVLSLSGLSSVANYQTALRSVEYRNNNLGASLLPRTLTFTATDPDPNTGSDTRRLVPLVSAAADNIVWSGAVSSAWTNGANWLAGRAPDANDVAIFNDADSVSNAVDVTGSLLAGEARFVNNADSFTFTGASLQTDKITQSGTGTNRINGTIAQFTSLDGQVSAGRLELNDLNNSTTLTSGNWTVSGGTLAAKVAGTQTGLGATDVTLAGGTLELTAGGVTTVNGFDERIFNRVVADAQSNIEAYRSATLGVDDARGILSTHLNYPNDAAFTTRATALGALGFNDGDFSALWVADFTPNATGAWGVRFSSVDDNVSIWVDYDRNGVFSTSGGSGNERVYYRGCCGGSGDQYTASLTSGQTYKFGIAMSDTGGGGYLSNVEVKSPAGSWTALNPSAIGLFTTQSVATGNNTNNVLVTANSTITLGTTLPGAKLGTLTMDPGVTLNVNSVDGVQDLEFANVVLRGAEVFNLVNRPDLTLGNVSEASPGIITFSGAGNVYLPTTNTYTGLTTIQNGVTVTASADGALGTAAAGTVVQSGGSLRLAGGVSYITPEPLTLNGSGNTTSDGALHNLVSDNYFYGPITLGSNSVIRSSANTLRLYGGLDTAGYEARFRGGSRVEFHNLPIIGGGSLWVTGNVTVYMASTANHTYTGLTTIEDGVLDAAGNNALGSTAGATNVLTGGTLLVRDGRTLGDSITIAGLGNDGWYGAIRNENNANVLTGQLTVSGTSRITVNATSLRLDGQVTGGTIDKMGTGTLILTNPTNNFAAVQLNEGAVRITHPGALALTPTISVDGGETLEFDGTMNASATALTSIAVNNGTISSVGGTATLDVPIALRELSNITFGGAGNLVVTQGFGNGAPALPANFLNHYGYRRDAGDAVMYLHNNTGMVNGGSPTTHPTFTGQYYLTTGPASRGLNFDTDQEFMAAVNVPWDNYSNLWIGRLHVTAADLGTWQFRDADRDDWSGIWFDINNNGIFESSVAGLGSNRGEQLAYNDQAAKSVNITAAGDYLIAFTHLEGGGGSRMEFRFKSPSMASETTIKPSDPAQASFWLPYLIPSVNNNVIKSGSGTLTLAGNNTFDGSVTVNAGMLVAGHNNAFGLPGGHVAMASGASLGFTGGVTITGENITGADGKAAGQLGTLVNLSGDNAFLGNITAATIPSAQEVSIFSQAGSLTIGAAGGGNTIDLNFSQLALAGPGDTVINSAISGKSSAELVAATRGYLFNGNTTRLPGDPNQLATKVAPGQVWFSDEIYFINYWGDQIIGLNNPGNPYDPNNYGNTFIGELNIGGTGTASVKFRHTSADDANRIRIDLDGDGVFESGSEDPYGADQGGNYTTGTVSVPRGVSRLVALQHREGGGGSRLQPEISLDNGTTWQRFTPGAMTGATFGITITPTPDVVKTGSGTATLAGNNTYTGLTRVLEGTLVAAHNNALGSTAAGTTVASGAFLALAGGVTIAGEPLTLSASPGTLRNLSGNNAWNGPIAAAAGVAGEIRLDSAAAGNTLSIGGNIDLQQSSLRVSGPGNTIIHTAIHGGPSYYDPTYVDAIQAANPLAWWRFEESGIVPGTTVAANSGSLGAPANGIYYGTGITTLAGLYGNAVRIQRTGTQYVGDTETATNLLLRNHSFTALAWFKRDETGSGDRMIFGTPVGGNNIGMHMGLRNSAPYMGFYANDLASGPTVSDTNWHLITFRFDDGGDPNNTATNQQAIFFDGVLQATRTGGAAFQGTDVLRLGHMNSDANAWSGLLDEIVIFSRALTAQEIAALYERRNGVGLVNPVNNLIKAGTGVLTLNGNNTYPGTTTIEAGTLLVNGNTSGQGNYFVKATGTLGGTGSIGLAPGASVTVEPGGFISPGLSPGVITINGDLLMDNGSGYVWELGATAYDQIAITGSLTLGNWTLHVVDAGGVAHLPERFYLFLGSFTDFGTPDVDFSQAPLWGQNSTGLTFGFDATGIYITGLASLPEPGTLTLLALGGLGLLARRRSRRNVQR